jgi:hypothetical protein
MPGFILHLNAMVQCTHLGNAVPTAPNQRVTVSGNAVALFNAPYQVTGCPNPVPPGSNGPCVTAQYTTSATRVFCNGVPVLLFDSQATCTPTAATLKTISTQMRAKGV